MLRDNDKNDKTYCLLEPSPFIEGLHVPVVIVYRMLDFESNWVLLGLIIMIVIIIFVIIYHVFAVCSHYVSKKRRINYMGILLIVQI